MRFPIRHFALPSRTLAQGMMRQKPRRIHFLRITGRIAIVWDSK